jgi:hypothetical protein
MNWRNASVAALLLVATALTIVAVRESSAFKQCNADSHQQEQESPQQSEKDAAHFFRVFISETPIMVRCTGYFVKKNESAITAVSTVIIAVFTIILGVFTISLAHSTRLAADAAERSAKYLRNAERPFFTPHDPTLANWGNEEDKVLEVHFDIRNVGKGLGFLNSYGIAREICAEGKEGSITPTIFDQMGRIMVPAEGHWSPNDAAFAAFQIGEEDRRAMRQFDRNLYVYGSSAILIFSACSGARALYSNSFPILTIPPPAPSSSAQTAIGGSTKKNPQTNNAAPPCRRRICHAEMAPVKYRIIALIRTAPPVRYWPVLTLSGLS